MTTRIDPTQDDDFKAQQKLEFDRYRRAIEIIQRMRQAGISCELFIATASDATAFDQARLRFATASSAVFGVVQLSERGRSLRTGKVYECASLRLSSVCLNPSLPPQCGHGWLVLTGSMASPKLGEVRRTNIDPIKSGCTDAANGGGTL